MLRSIPATAMLLTAAILAAGVLITSPMQGQPLAAGKRYAVLVGVEQYDHPKLREPLPLKYAVDDVTALGAVLKAAGYEVTVLCDDTGAKDASLLPTRANIDKKLQAVLRGCKRNDTVVVAFAGHGLQFAGGKDAYFCPQDARPFASEVASLLSISHVYEELEKSFAGVKVILVDACRNDPDPGRGRGLDADSAPPPPKGVAALFSCSAGQKAFEHDELRHGVFFHHVLEGFKGEAANRRGEVTFDGLSAYIRESVPETMKRLLPDLEQSPNLKADLVGVPPVLVRLTIPKPPVTPIKPPSPPPATVGTKAGDTRDDNGLKLTLVWCPPGQFQMGSPDSDKDAEDDEKPQVAVTLTRGFWLGQTEVTQGQVRQVLGIEPWKGKEYAKEGPDYAASYINWEEAKTFCEKFTASERLAGRLGAGEEYRLPTEAEWEYACRAGRSTVYGFGDDSAQLGDYAWCGGLVGGNTKSEKYVHPVKLKKANSWGLHDMHGNVWEWCRDWYGEKLPGGTDPENTVGASHRVSRGGGWGSRPASCRSAGRNRDAPEVWFYNRGFRLARSQSSR